MNQLRKGRAHILATSILASMAWMLMLAGGAKASGQTAFYISPQGNDAWSGTSAEPNAARQDGPFATLEAARDAVRKLKMRGPLAEPVTIYLRAGVYRLGKTF